MLVSSCRQAVEPPAAVVLAEARQQLVERGRTDQAVRENFGVGGVVDSAEGAAMARADSAVESGEIPKMSGRSFPTNAVSGVFGLMS